MMAPRVVRVLLRRALKAVCTIVPPASRLVHRLPFSRCAPLIPALLGGSEQITWRGVRLDIDPGEFGGFFRYFAPDGPDPEYDWLLAQCATAGLFLDVGANSGIYGLAMASACPGLRVIAFEPDAANIARIRRNLSLNPEFASRVTVEQAAAGERTGTAAFEPASPANSGTGRLQAPGRLTIDVPVVALDDYCRDLRIQPDVVKIDVEGAELDVLRGLQAHWPAAIAIELHPANWPDHQRAGFQRDVLAVLASRNAAYQFLLNEREWRDAMSADEPWPARLHVFMRAPRSPDVLRTPPPGAPAAESQKAELTYWAEGGWREFDHQLDAYRRLFPFDGLDFNRSRVLDVGSGALSVFERVAPRGAAVTPYDTLADQFNALVPERKFAIQARLPDATFEVVTLFNCLDHMDRPDQLLAALTPRLAADGTAWIYCDVDRPFSSVEHPQCFRFWDLVALTSRFFDIDRCGLTRDGPLFPYAWWGIVRPRRARRAMRAVRIAMWTGGCAAHYARFHAVRAAVKATKLVGRRLLPPPPRLVL